MCNAVHTLGVAPFTNVHIYLIEGILKALPFTNVHIYLIEGILKAFAKLVTFYCSFMTMVGILFF